MAPDGRLPDTRSVNAGDPSVIPVVPPAAAGDEVSLLEIRKKIYVRAVHGWFARWRWGLVLATQLVFYGLPWLSWNGRQAVLFEIAERKFYLFGLVLWPQDVIYLAALLVIAALRAVPVHGGRGPVVVRLRVPADGVHRDLPVDREEDRGRARRRESSSTGPRPSLEKFVIKAEKHVAWLAIALWTGYTFVGYFSPIRELGIRAMTWQLGPWEAFWILFYGFATYGNAGFMREQVCKYMCPYARFQSAMFDRDTLIIAYDRERGEPRGARTPQGRSAQTRVSATASTATFACRCVRPASTSARGCSTNASAAPPASTAATRSWTRWATRGASSATRRRMRSRNTTTGRRCGSGCCARAR